MGQLVGDALGGAVRGWEPERIRSVYPDGVWEMVGNAELGTIPGQPSANSELALVLARSLAEHGEYHESSARDAYREWLRSAAVNEDPTLRGALEGAADSDSTSNRALMRASPIGIFGSRVWSGVVELWSREDAAITHPNPVCLAANELYAIAIANAIRVPSPREALFEHLRARADVDVILADQVKKARTDPPDYLSRPDSVVVALHNALWQLRPKEYWPVHAESFEQALVDTVSRGGDTDTNAAVCGALLGAVLGHKAIPERWARICRWRETVLSCRPNVGVARPRPKEYWPVDALELAEKLVADRPAGTPIAN